MFIKFVNEFCSFLDIDQEKTIQNIEGFDKKNLKHAETEVKNPLPDGTGTLRLYLEIRLAYLWLTPKFLT